MGRSDLELVQIFTFMYFFAQSQPRPSLKHGRKRILTQSLNVIILRPTNLNLITIFVALYHIHFSFTDQYESWEI